MYIISYYYQKNKNNEINFKKINNDIKEKLHKESNLKENKIIKLDKVDDKEDYIIQKLR